MQFVDNVTPNNVYSYIDSAMDQRGILGDYRKQLGSDWATMYYQNAYNTALMNYQNEYNSPLQQMLRYQAAGLNPNLAASDAGNMTSTHGGAAPKGNFVAPSSLETLTKTMASVQNVVQGAAEIYDYLKFGKPMHAQEKMNLGLQGSVLRENLRKYIAEADWAEYWNYNPDNVAPDTYRGSMAVGSPRSQYMENSTNYKAAQIDQIQSIISVLYPAQADAAKATAALNNYKKLVLQGQKGAILDLDTGNSTADGILKLVLMKLIDVDI